MRVSPIFLQHQYTPTSRAAVADPSASHRPLEDIMLPDRNRPWGRPVCKRGPSRPGTFSLPPPSHRAVIPKMSRASFNEPAAIVPLQEAFTAYLPATAAFTAHVGNNRCHSTFLPCGDGVPMSTYLDELIRSVEAEASEVETYLLQLSPRDHRSQRRCNLNRILQRLHTLKALRKN
jgi:hypothetical protein